jgi:hypothetical protein
VAGACVADHGAGHSKTKSNGAVIGGSIVGVLIGVGMVGVVIWWWRRKVNAGENDVKKTSMLPLVVAGK